LSSEIKISIGNLQGKIIKTLSGKKYRPTMEQGRISLFNSLREKIKDSYFLDLFSGSGIVGIEALSLGAKKVVFVENHLPAIRLLRININNLNMEEKVEIFSYDVFSFLKNYKGEKFDIIFIDPPYILGGRINELLKLIVEKQILNNDGIIIIEHHKKIKLIDCIGDLILFQEKKFGETIFSYYKMKEKNNV
jgi:16S rRNA (guanine(966)-N(2))-methyltransferase RsmD